MTYSELRKDPRVFLTGAGLFGMRPALALGGPGDRLALCAIRAGHAAPDADTVVVSGIGVPYERLSASPDYTPRYLFRRGSFRKSLAERRDLPILFDYSSAKIMGRTSAATATIYETERGVEFECQPPDAMWANDLLVSLQRRDISGCGIAAVILRRHNELRDGEQIVVIDESDLITISISSFPAFDCGITVHGAASSAAAAATTIRNDKEFLRTVGIVSAGRL
jgi:HK97 family phage prohead protease